MSDQKSELEIEVDADEPTAIGSNGHIGAIAFNLDVIAARNPELAGRIKQLYEEAKTIKLSDELDGAEEDIALVSDMFNERLEEEK